MYVWIVHNFATTIIMKRRKRSLAIFSPYEWTKSRKHENIPYIEKDNLKEILKIAAYERKRVYKAMI